MPKYQLGGDTGSTDFFNLLADAYASRQDEPNYAPEEEPTPAESTDDAPQDDYDSRYDELMERYSDLESRFNDLSTQQQNVGSFSSDDEFMNFLFSDDNRGPIDFDNLADGHPGFRGVGSFSSSSFSSQIASREGNYNSVSPNSSAVGKYQFLWGTHGNDIARVTGVHSKEEFRRNPQAQEQYFQYWDSHVLSPEARQVLPQLRQYYPNITEEQAKMMIHFGGLGNVQKAIRTGNFKGALDANGTSLHGYVFGKRYQFGGVAHTEDEKRTGLNNPHFDEMFFPMHGTNTFRGLDSGEPVLLMDETGQQIILHHNQQTARLKGNVYEQRL